MARKIGKTEGAVQTARRGGDPPHNRPGHPPVGPPATAGPSGVPSEPTKHLPAPRLRQAGTKPLRLALVDDDPKTQAEVRALVEAQAGGWVLDVFPTPQSAFRNPPFAAPPAVVLMEIGAHGSSGIEHIRELKALWPALPVVVFTSRSDTGAMLQAIMAGAQGYLLKPLAPADLLRVIRDAVAGRQVFCQEALSAATDFLGRTGARPASWGITDREWQVLCSAAQNLRDKDIAERLDIETSTVHAHLKRIFHKLHVHTRAKAVQKVFRVHPRT